MQEKETKFSLRKRVEQTKTGSRIDLPRVTIFDADFVPFIICNNKKGDDLKTLQNCLDICDDFIHNICKSTEADHYVGYLTVGKCFRYAINTDYKAKRKYTNIPPYTYEVRQHLIDQHGFKGQKDYEADDLVVSYKAQRPEYECTIVSPDKDILNLEGTHFNPRTMKYCTILKYDADEFFWKSMIKGDTIDGIKGIPGKGEKYFDAHVAFYGRAGATWHELTLTRYIEHFGEYEGIKEFTKNYLSLKLIDNVLLEDIKLNDVNKELSEQKTGDRGVQEESQ
jgi:hypothetical protein